MFTRDSGTDRSNSNTGTDKYKITELPLVNMALEKEKSLLNNIHYNILTIYYQYTYKY